MHARLATPEDAGAIAAIYNEEIADGTATFDTSLRTEDDVRAWFDGAHPVVVVEEEGAVVGFASSSAHRAQECYAGVAELGVYVAREKRGRGVGKVALEHLMDRVRAAGFWKLLSSSFVENEAGRALLRRLGFREVGTYIRHAKLDGKWRDVVVAEKFLAPVSPPRVAPTSSGAVRAAAAVESGPFDAASLDGALDAFTSASAHDPATRERFVRRLQAHGATSGEAAQDLWRRLLARFDDPARRADLARFYETLFVVKQAIKLSAGRLHAADLAPERQRLLDWLKDVIALPPDVRGRISPGNVSNLLMSLVAMTAESDDQRRDVLSLVPEAVARHHMEPPASLRPAALSTPPSAPVLPPSPPSQPAVLEPAAEAPPPKAKKRAKKAAGAKRKRNDETRRRSRERRR